MSQRPGRARLLALAVVISFPLVGMSTVAAAKPGLHRATRSDVAGSTWTATEAPVPADAWPSDERSWITATSCPAPGTCVAVGYYNNASDDGLGLIDTITDGASTMMEAPLPPHSRVGSLTGVTCSSVAFCVAIGNEGNDQGLIETWADGRWTATEAPLPSDAPKGSGVTLSAVACPADGSCVIVGSANFDNPGQEGFPFIDTLSGGTWTSADAPLPANAVGDFPFNGLTSVSCPAMGSCVAAGTYFYDATDNLGLIDTLADGSWTAQAAPAPPSSAANQNIILDSVACPATGWCQAIGEYSTAASPEDSVIETLSDGSWTVIEAPIPPGAPSDVVLLYGLACPAVGSCDIVGSYSQSSGSIAEDLSGGTWTPTSLSSVESDLSGLACPAVGSCVAVGAVDGVGGEPVVATLSNGVWNWATEPVPANAGVEPGPGNPGPDFPPPYLTTVSCATVDSCAALGQYSIPTPTHPNGAQESLIETLGLGEAQAPVISSPDQATFTSGQAGSFTVTASGAPTPVLSEKGKLPQGLRFEKGSGTAMITGKPSKKTGSYSITITATSTSTDERVGQPFVVTVNS